MAGRNHQVELAACEIALNDLIVKIIDHENVNGKPALLGDEQALWWREIGKSAPDAAQVELRDLTKDAVGYSLRHGIKQLGTAIFRLSGGTDVMREMHDRIADLDPRWAARRYSIIDNAWDGIGGGADRWWSGSRG